MKPALLELDFAPGARAWRRWGLVLFALGGSALALTVITFAQAWSARLDQQGGLSMTLTQRVEAEARSTRRVVVSTADLARDHEALQMVRVLQTPWADLLATLEAAAMADVALLVIDPSPAKQTLRLTAQARNPAAMLAYLEGLQSDRRLSQVALVSHQVELQAPGTPVRFQIQAAWGALP